MSRAEAAPTGHVADAERSVLAAMLLGSDAISRARGLLDPSMFFRTDSGRVFDAMCALADRGEPADSITTSAELARRGDVTSIAGGWRVVIADILEAATTTANTEAHARIVREAAAKRALRRLGFDLQVKAEEQTLRATAVLAWLECECCRIATMAGARR